MDAITWQSDIGGDLRVPKRNTNFQVPTAHKDLIYMAKLAEQAERYDEMVACMKKYVKLNADLGVEERNLLSVAYKNVIGTRRASWRIVTSIEGKEDKRPDDYKQMMANYRHQFEKEITLICDDILQLLDERLIPACSGGEPEVFLYKMKGDYHRYHAETSNNPQQRTLAANAYKKALEEAERSLASTHPIRLGLVLNYSVFHYEIMKEKALGLELARKAFDDAVIELDSLDEDSYKESTLIMQLLRDNLTLWHEDMTEERRR